MHEDEKLRQLTDHQRKLYNNMTLVQQETCLNVLNGMSWMEAYCNNPFNCTDPNKTASSGASAMQRNKNVQAFMKSIREMDIDDRIMSRNEALRILSRQARGSIADVLQFKSEFLGMCPKGGGPMWRTFYGIKHVSEMDPEMLANIMEISTDTNGNPKIKQYNTVNAIQRLSIMQGWDSATKHEISGTNGGPVETVQMNMHDYKEAREQMIKEDDC